MAFTQSETTALTYFRRFEAIDRNAVSLVAPHGQQEPVAIDLDRVTQRRETQYLKLRAAHKSHIHEAPPNSRFRLDGCNLGTITGF